MSTAREFFESTLPAKLTPDSAAAIGAHFQFNIDGAGGAVDGDHPSRQLVQKASVRPPIARSL